MNQGIREDSVLAFLFEYLQLLWLRLQHYPERVPSDFHHLFSAFCCIGHAREIVGFTLIVPSVFIIAWWGVGNFFFFSVLWQIWARNSKLEIHFPIEYFSLKQKWVSNSYMFNSSWNSWVLYFITILHFLNCQHKPLSSFYHQY